jgi:hypothetical protein
VGHPSAATGAVRSRTSVTQGLTGKHGYTESGGIYTALQDLGDRSQTVALGINESGTVVGYYVVGNASGGINS